MSLQLLRPMALPRPTTLRYFLGIARLSTNPSSASPTKEAISTSAPIPSQTTPATAPNQPYYVSRTPSKQLPVYALSRAGGNLRQTKIKRIEGDIMKLKEQLEEAFSDKEIRVNQLTKHIIIKGWCKLEVKEFLKERHF
ncbi:hypothetical protein BELL_0586g00030 [Botrytis elliptica]|uniref:Large ribosomal subunit protein mL49 n=1 Tax=Botrytis elliptica TaxID=278938 RepID=A0A4Z1JCS1_9HELO|nr:hypothetical protein EAE99_007357 [Botrytis elliptica]TGO71368.1 hypothetical protein BELL_0586g00030 [Botrytis elliptica]